MSKKNAASIVESSGRSVDFPSEAGIFSCLLEHEVKATKATFEWTGPKFTEEQWNEMLAYFRWTYNTEKSESQVRLFVHPTEGWKIWAFPQRGGTSMTTKEIDNEDFKLQRAAIRDGYIPFGTVHHHCASPAFQSSVDTADEKNVDGLHITIGRIDEKQYDMHVRMYIKGHRFDPNMGAFWDIGDDAREKIEWVAGLGYSTPDVESREAKFQMCIPPEADQAFPDLWKANYILPERVTVTSGFPTGTSWCYHCSKHTDHLPEKCPNKGGGKRRRHKHGNGHATFNQGTNDRWGEKAIAELLENAKIRAITDKEVMEIMESVGGPESQVAGFYQDIVDCCDENYLELEKLYELYVKHVYKQQENGTQEATDGDATRVQAVTGPIAQMNAAKEAAANGDMTPEEIEFYMGQRISGD